MKRYKNTKTGAVISSSCKVSGGDWVLCDKEPLKEENRIEEVESVKKEEVSAKESVKEQKKVKEAKKDESNESSDGVTKKQIMQELDAMGIKYDKNDRKDVLYKLMIGE